LGIILVVTAIIIAIIELREKGIINVVFFVKSSEHVHLSKKIFYKFFFGDANIMRNLS